MGITEEEIRRQDDKEYARRYWIRQPPGMREVMERNIKKSATEEGVIYHFVDPQGIKEDDKEKLSAFRILARQMGYDIGQYHFDKHAHVASAKVRKKTKRK
jgi:hypothetical protein